MSASCRPNQPIRLTYVITDLAIGGVPLYLYRLATRLPRDRFQIHVVSLADAGPVGDMLVSAGIAVSSCGARTSRDMKALHRLWRILKTTRPQVLHALLFHANIACRLVGPLADVPINRIVCEIQTVELERPWHLVLDNLTCRLCRLEVGNSPSVVAHLRRKAHLPASRLSCQWGAVDVTAIDAAEPADRAMFGIPPDQPLVIWTGRLDPVKGFEEMLSAFARLRQTLPASLLLVGDGPYRPAVERLIAEYRLDQSVKFAGSRPDVPSLLKMADAFLFCSRTEGLPNSLLEAMAAGLPVVATDVPGCRDVVIHGQTGLLSRAGSAVDIERKLALVLTNRRLSADLGARAHDWVRTHLDVQKWSEHWELIYSHIAQDDSSKVSADFPSIPR
ncbi:MAG: glycosyltransferase [Phycisphaerae bacterium]